MSRNPSCTIYVGNLPGDVREEEIEDLFYKYGRIVDIELKLPPRPPGFCFVEFEDARDAEDAIEGRNGYKYDGNYLRVELAHGGRGLPPSADRHSNHSSGRGAPIPRRAEFRVLVTKLPQTASWQDLKDHMRKAGDVSFAQVFREGGGTVGIVDYTNYEDMKYAIRKLDDSEFRNRYSRAYIRDHKVCAGMRRASWIHPSLKVQEEKGRGNARRSYSPRPKRSRSDSRGPSRSRSRSQSKSNPNSPPAARAGSRSASRSLSTSPAPQKVSKAPSNRDSMSRSPSRSRSRSRSPKPRTPS